MLNQAERDFLIGLLERGEEIPEDFKYKLFPVTHKEYELAYAGKMRKEDLLANEDGSFPVPVQVDKVFSSSAQRDDEPDDWNNMIFLGDNLQFLKTVYADTDPVIAGKIKGKVRLIYIDPPFATADEFQNRYGAKAYQDKKKGAEFVEFLRRRLFLAREILAPDGSIYIHLDNKMVHYVKVIADEVFGKNNFRREIIWNLPGAAGYKSLVNSYVRGHDTILYYTRSDEYIFHKEYLPYNEKQLKRFTGTDEQGRSFKPITKDKVIYLDESKGVPVTDVWSDIASFQTVVNSPEIVDYPTQKPEALLKRIIRCSTDPGDLVLDFFGGSGTTAATAEKLGRKWVVCDIGKLSYFTIQRRILQIGASKSLENPKKKYGREPKDFMICRLGTYDLKSALELEWKKYQIFVAELFGISLFDLQIGGYAFEGEKDGCPVKIFHFNRWTDSNIDQAYLEDMHARLAKRMPGGRVYIVVPSTRVDFLTDYEEIDNIRYYFLKIPYQIIRELHQKPFQKFRQPQSRNAINSLDEAVGFSFVRTPSVDSSVTVSDTEVILEITRFSSNERAVERAPEEKSLSGFDLLSAVYLDCDYNGQDFVLTHHFFLEDLQNTDGVMRISLDRAVCGKRMMAVYTDIYGNDFSESFLL